MELGRPPERIADRVWLARGGFASKVMKIYLIEEDAGGVTLFDAGVVVWPGHANPVRRDVRAQLRAAAAA